jgi:hypothetical protein
MNRRVLIPVFFLILAALACDSPYYDPPHVSGVKADPDTPGRVYATVHDQMAQYNCAQKANATYDYTDCEWEEQGEPYTYRSDDYGQTWQRVETQGEMVDGGAVVMDGEKLFHDGAAVWWFPRPGYRSFFFDDDNGQRFNLRHAGVDSRGADGALYVGMGTEGVLTFRTPNEWYLSAAGIAELTPSPLTVTNPADILKVVLLGLLVPPLPLIHAYLLTRVWLYVMTPRRAWTLALIVSTFLTALAGVAITIWVTDANTDFYPIVAVMSVITVLVSAVIGWAAAPAPQARSVAYFTALFSLFVPIGVATVWIGWVFIIPTVTTYAIFRRSYAVQLERNEGVTAGVLDHLALASVGIAIGCGFTVYIGTFFLEGVLHSGGLLFMAAWIGAVVWSARWIRQYAQREIAVRGWQARSLQAHLNTAAVLCYALPAVFAGLTFWGQMGAKSWFGSLW